MTTPLLLPDGHLVHRVDHRSAEKQPAGAILATEDYELIRRWAMQHSAEPATGEATPSGPATADVRDGDAGIRFNFPGAARFRPITWDEWFENFTDYGLLFVYQGDEPGRAPDFRYRLVRKEKLHGSNGAVTEQ